MDLHSQLSADECKRRLRERTDAPGSLGGGRPAIGWTLGGWYWAQKRLGYRNAFQGHILVHITDSEAGGADIDTWFGPSPLVVLIIVIWLGTIAHQWVAHPRINPAILPGIGIALVIITAGALMARGEKSFMEDLVAQTTEAKSVRSI